MHILDLPSSLRDNLIKSSIPEIQTKVVFRGSAKVSTGTNVDGTHNFTSSYQLVEIDLTDRLSNQFPITLDFSRPVLPSGKGNNIKASDFQVAIINEKSYWAVSQDGAIFDPNSISLATISIYAKVVNDEFLVFAGQVLGHPEEREGMTIFTITDSIFSIINRPVRFFNYLSASAVENDGNNVVIQPVPIRNGNAYIEFNDASMYYDGSGNPKMSIVYSDKSKILLRRIVFANFFGQESIRGFACSKYVIKFTGPTSYTVFPPDSIPVQGETTQDLFTSNFGIQSIDWFFREDAEGNRIDPTGVDIEVFVYLSYKGNPITIIKELIGRAMKPEHTEIFQNDPSMPVDWEILDLLEAKFASQVVFISETNKDTFVYDPTSSKSPISYKNVIERICEHIGISMVPDFRGRISFASNLPLVNQQIHPINSDVIIEHSFLGGNEEYEAIRLRYGWDDRDGVYNKEIRFFRPDFTVFNQSSAFNIGDVVIYGDSLYRAMVPKVADAAFQVADWQLLRVNEFELNLKHYKAGIHDVIVQNFACKFSDYIYGSHVRFRATLFPNVGFSMRPGDIVQMEFTSQPVKTLYAMIYKVSGIIGDQIQIEGVEINEPISQNDVCNFNLCETKLN